MSCPNKKQCELMQAKQGGQISQKISDVPITKYPITLTKDTVKMVYEAMKEENFDKEKWLYIGVRNGGCAGLEYVLDFVDEPTEDDWFKDEQHKLKTCTDPKSAQFLIGTTISYENTLMGAGFKFDNPFVEKKCGCGMSFG